MDTVSLHKVRARVPGSEYDILVKPGILAEAGAIARALSRSRKAAIVTDDAVGPLYLSKLQESLKTADFQVFSVVLPNGEGQKNLTTLGKIYDQLLSAGIERSTPLLALGGGVIGDMTGFAAATLLRGIKFIQVPTTLLSMVDASVGGKTGINHSVGKNLIGAFHQPISVLIDPETLRSLDPRELQSGLAECIKHEIIRDAEGFAKLENEIDRALKVDVEYLAKLIAHNVQIKADVVSEDPFEHSVRAHLNFGHTFGHAIETVSCYEYAHGECVALGMVAACRAAVKLGMFDATSCQRVIKLIEKAGLPVSGLRLSVDEIVASMIYDKKVKSGRVRFVLPTKIGEVVIRDDLSPTVVREAVESLK